MTYSLDFRKKVLSIKESEGLSFEDTSKRFGIAKNSVYLWSKDINPKQGKSRPDIKLDKLELLDDVKNNPDLFQYERAEKFGVSQSCVCYALKNLEMTYKKTYTHPKADPEKQKLFEDELDKHISAGRNIVYGDESGFAYHTPRTHGYSIKGDRCYGIKDFSNKKRTNVIGALYGKDLICLGLFECNIDTTIYTNWVENELVKALPENSVYIIDNVSFHNKKLLEPILEKFGHTLLFLPPYSPEHNKIENKWAQAKHFKRKYGCDVDELFSMYM